MTARRARGRRRARPAAGARPRGRAARSALGLLALAAALAVPAAAQAYEGALEAGDDRLNSGEYLDAYPLEVRAGQTVHAVVTSRAFDTYVIVKSTAGDQAEDDDCTDGETTRSCTTFVAAEDGPVRVLVTSFAVGETGPYRLEVVLGDGARVEDGALEDGDATLGGGEFVDEFAAVGTGGPLVLDLEADAFGPYLVVLGPDGQATEADGDGGRSRLVVPTEDGAFYRVLVTSRAPGGAGPYRLRLTSDAASDLEGP